jgi:hypothetical protein
MTKKHQEPFWRHPIKLALVSIGGLVAVVGLILGLVWYDMAVGFGAPSRPDFQGYAPPEQLNGEKLQESKLIRLKQFGIDVWRFEYQTRYGEDVVVSQSKADLRYTNVLATCKTRQLEVSGDYTYACKEYSLENGGRYIVYSAAYKQKLFALDVEALLGDTTISVRVPSNLVEKYKGYEQWREFFTAFKPVDIREMPFTHHTTGQTRP